MLEFRPRRIPSFSPTDKNYVYNLLSASFCITWGHNTIHNGAARWASVFLPSEPVKGSTFRIQIQITIPFLRSANPSSLYLDFLVGATTLARLPRLLLLLLFVAAFTRAVCERGDNLELGVLSATPGVAV